jgi:hypothetical protein
MEDTYYQRTKEAARKAYAAAPAIRSPYFGGEIVLGPEGFQHIQCSGRRARPLDEQVRRFILLPLGLQVLQTATTVQDYRRALVPVEAFSKSAGPRPTDTVQWWGFVAVFVEQHVKVRVVVRKVGSGELHFWSIMPFRNPGGKRRRREQRRTT